MEWWTTSFTGSIGGCLIALGDDKYRCRRGGAPSQDPAPSFIVPYG